MIKRIAFLLLFATPALAGDWPPDSSYFQHIDSVDGAGMVENSPNHVRNWGTNPTVTLDPSGGFESFLLLRPVGDPRGVGFKNDSGKVHMYLNVAVTGTDDTMFVPVYAMKKFWPEGVGGGGPNDSMDVTYARRDWVQNTLDTTWQAGGGKGALEREATPFDTIYFVSGGGTGTRYSATIPGNLVQQVFDFGLCLQPSSETADITVQIRTDDISTVAHKVWFEGWGTPGGFKIDRDESGYDVHSNWIDIENTTTNNSTDDDMWMGLETGAVEKRTLLRFPALDDSLSAYDIPGTNAIDSSILFLNVRFELVGSNDTMHIRFRLLLQPWVEAEATWLIYSTGNSWDAAGAKTSGTDFSATNAMVADSIEILDVIANDDQYFIKLDPAEVEALATSNNGWLIFNDYEFNFPSFAWETEDESPMDWSPEITVYFSSTATRTILGVGR